MPLAIGIPSTRSTNVAKKKTLVRNSSAVDALSLDPVTIVRTIVTAVAMPT